MNGACDGQHEKIPRHRLRMLEEVLRVIDGALEGVEHSGEPAWVSVREAREGA